MSLTRKIPKVAVLCGAALGVAMVAQSASANIIEHWDYTVDSSFTAWHGSSGHGDVQATNGNTKLTWPVPEGSRGQSSIQITGHVDGSVESNSGSAPGATFTHSNNVISSNDTSLTSFTLLSKLHLTAQSDSSITQDLDLTFNGNFKETPNSGTCVVTSSPSPCSDIFVLTNAAAGHGLDANNDMVFQQLFDIDDDHYSVVLKISGLSALDSDVCHAAGANSGCIGLVTAENKDSVFDSSFRVFSPPIHLRSVPGPGSLIMLVAGLALVGFGWMTRRSQRGKMTV